MEVRSATGYLAQNWMELNVKTPAIIANPEASPLDVLSWCWGEVESLYQVTDAFAAAGADIDSNVLGAVYLHRLAPLSPLMRDAIQALVSNERKVRQSGSTTEAERA